MFTMDGQWVQFYLLAAVCLLPQTSLGNVIDAADDGSIPTQDQAASSEWHREKIDLHMAAEGMNKADTEEALEKYRLSPQAAKTMLRDRRGWGLWWEEEDEREENERSNERRAAEAAAEYDRYLNQICPNSCWGSWSSWSSCSAQCGNSGTKRRSRSTSPRTECVSWVRSRGCPGSSSTTAACNRLCHNGGTARATSCSCPPSHTGTCCETAVTCSNPGSPNNGEVTPGGSLHYYGAVVRFSCHVGYRLTGATSRTCQTSGQWSNSVPICSLVYCTSPEDPLNGAVSGTDFSYGTFVTYSCSIGYDLVGDSLQQCQDDGTWSGQQPSCNIIECPEPVQPVNGGVQTPGGAVYNQYAEYACNYGYYMSGTQHRRCTEDGFWSGVQPECDEIICDEVLVPSNGRVVYDDVSRSYGSEVTYSCDLGYVLQGHQSQVCEGTGPTGVWSGQQPICQGVDCGAPNNIANGVISTPTGTSFPTGSWESSCHAGYYMNGASQASCQYDGLWSQAIPECLPCDLGMYKTGLSTATTCEPCPAHSSTASFASTSIEQCECELGFKGPDGGPCTEITCEELIEPSNSRKDACGNTYDDTCTFTCDDGYIGTGGDARRTCQLNEQWSGSQLVCTACGVDLYKHSENECRYCPENSHTIGVGHEWDGCICDEGFTGPGEQAACSDINECGVANGGCEQTCENESGSYRCACTLPGHIPTVEDPSRCQHKNDCPDLEPVDDGGLVCVLEQATTTRRCQVRCNYGYEHLVSPNAYEECGPSTGWLWSTELNNEHLSPCIASFFPGVEVELSMFYFTASCEEIASADSDSIKQDYIDFLQDEKGVCVYGMYVCQIEDVSIECGVSTSTDEDDGFVPFPIFSWGRRRRSASAQELVRFRIRVLVDPVQQLNVDCQQVCDRPYSLQYCQDTCLVNYQAHLVVNLHQELITALAPSSLNETIILADDIVITPYQQPNFRSPVFTCDPNMVTIDGVCGICPPGFFQEDGECRKCPFGSYQPDDGQTGCLQCPAGTYQDLKGQAECKPCPTGTSQSEMGQANCSSCPWAYKTGTGDCAILLQTIHELALYLIDGSTPPCLAGTYRNTAGGACEECPTPPTANSSSCRNCPWLLPWGQLSCSSSSLEPMRDWMNEGFIKTFNLF